MTQVSLAKMIKMHTELVKAADAMAATRTDAAVVRDIFQYIGAAVHLCPTPTQNLSTAEGERKVFRDLVNQFRSDFTHIPRGKTLETFMVPDAKVLEFISYYRYAKANGVSMLSKDQAFHLALAEVERRLEKCGWDSAKINKCKIWKPNPKRVSELISTYGGHH